MNRTIASHAHRLERSTNRLAGLLHTDFCPGLNRYVYWLKEPIGWFVLAAAACMLVGATLNPIGWQLAAGIGALIVLGLSFPWLAVRTAVCRIEPARDRLCERESCTLSLTIRNRLPIPLWGLMIEDYLSLPPTESEAAADEHAMQRGDVGLAGVAPFTESTFQLTLQPDFRGHYPQVTPRIACAFPFGLWTARRAITEASPVIVWPLRPELSRLWDVSGSRSSDVGSGNRIASAGEFAGVRPFRRGDSLRSIHWVQTARTESVVVCERMGPQQQFVSIELNCDRIEAEFEVARENLAWRVRLAAALGELLIKRQIGVRLSVMGNRFRQDSPEHASPRALTELLDRLAAIPLDGVNERSIAYAHPIAPVRHRHGFSCNHGQTDSGTAARSNSEFRLIIQAAADADSVPPHLRPYLLRLTAVRPPKSRSDRPCEHDCLLDWRCDMIPELQTFLREVEHGRIAA